jgi:LuxR family transcriptional regulator, quorum-sensing system regulator BjaR1
MRESEVTDQYWAVRALDFVTALEAASTCDGVLKLFREEIAQVGFHSLLMTIVNDRERDFSRRVIPRFWHPEWVTMYESEQMTDDDPVRRKLSRSTKPFLWTEAQYDPWRESRAKEVMERATDFRMKQGLCVPIYHHGGLAAAINIAGEKPDLGRGVRKALHVMSLSTYNRFCALVGPPLDNGKLLTDREREVVKWVSAGKSDWDIGAILNISERTARAHVSNAARKLGVANRTALAVEGVRLSVFAAHHL